MTAQIEAMKMALKAMTNFGFSFANTEHLHAHHDAITALRAAIEAAEKMEPFGYVAFNKLHSVYDFERENDFDERYIGVTKVYLHPPSAEIEELRKDAEQPKVAATQDEFLFWFNVTFPGSGVDEYWAYDMCQQWAKYAAMQEKQP